jgi:hypothetical protein
MKTRQEPAVPTRRNFLQIGLHLAAVAAAGPLGVASVLQAGEPAPLFDGSDPAWSVEPDGLLVRRVGDDHHLYERVD